MGTVVTRIGSRHRISGPLTVSEHKRGGYRQPVAGFEVDTAVRELSAALLPRADALAVGMADRIRSEVPLYAEGRFLSAEES